MKIYRRESACSKKKLIYSSKHKTMKETLESAVKKGVDLSYAWLPYCHLEDGADLRNGKFSNANFRESSWTKVNLSGADLSHAFMCGVHLHQVNLSKTNLHYTYLSNSMMWNVNMTGAIMDVTILWGASMYRVNLCGVDLSNVPLFGIESLKNVNLSGATITKGITLTEKECKLNMHGLMVNGLDNHIIILGDYAQIGRFVKSIDEWLKLKKFNNWKDLSDIKDILNVVKNSRKGRK